MGKEHTTSSQGADASSTKAEIRALERESRNQRAVQYAKTISFRNMAASLYRDLTVPKLRATVRTLLPADETVSIVPLAKVVAETQLNVLGLTPFIDLQLADSQELTSKLTGDLSAQEIEERRAVIGYTWKTNAVVAANEISHASRQLQGFPKEADRAYDSLIAEHMDVVKQVARKYRGKGAEVEELTSVGNIKLIACADRFDWRRDISFESYVRQSVDGTIRHFFRDNSGRRRPVYENTPAVLRIVEGMQSNGETVTYAEVAKRAEISEELVREILNDPTSRTPLSLFELTATGSTLGDNIPQAERGFDEVVNAETVRGLLGLLNEKEQQILRLRFFADMSQSQIAAELGVSQMHISRLLKGILLKLRTALLDGEVEPASLDKSTGAKMTIIKDN